MTIFISEPVIIVAEIKLHHFQLHVVYAGICVTDNLLEIKKTRIPVHRQ